MVYSQLPGSLEAEYRLLSHINSGFFGAVYKYENIASGEAVAVKFIRSEGAQQEASISTSLVHDSIIRTYGAYKMNDSSVALVQEYADCGDLFDYINTVGLAGDEDAVKDVFGQLVRAVAYMHSTHGIAHRDIKPENVCMTSDGAVKLIDFGLAERRRFVKWHVGTNPYCAPEVLALPDAPCQRMAGKRAHAGRCRRVDGFAADIFSLGVTLFAMVTGNLPWDSADPSADADYAAFERRHAQGVKGAVFAADPPGVSRHLCRLFDAMLHPDPRMRASVTELFQYLDQPWLTTRISTEVAAASTPPPIMPNRMGGTGADSGVSVSTPTAEQRKFLWSDLEDDEAYADELPPIPVFT